MALDGAFTRGLIGVALAGSLCLSGVPLSARAPSSTREQATTRAATTRQPTGAVGRRATSIQGGAWHADNTPIPGALVRLRNVVTGKTLGTTVADETGQFKFSGIPEGTYLVEMVTGGGKVLTVGHVFSVAAGETVATFVRLGAKVPWFNGFFGNAALAVAASAATAGVVALSPGTVTAVSPNR